MFVSVTKLKLILCPVVKIMPLFLRHVVTIPTTMQGGNRITHHAGRSVFCIILSENFSFSIPVQGTDVILRSAPMAPFSCVVLHRTEFHFSWEQMIWIIEPNIFAERVGQSTYASAGKSVFLRHPVWNSLLIN